MQQALSQRLLTCLLLSTSTSAAGETIVLRNGYRLQAEHHETEAHCIRLRTSNGGWIALQTSSVLRIEPDPPSQPPGTVEDVPPAEPREPALQPDAIEQFSREAGLPEALVRAVVWTESGFQPDAVSPKGAVGLMQLMPATAAELGVNPQISSENLRGGIRYLKQLLERFAGQEDQLVRALAAYNAGRRGPGASPYTMASLLMPRRSHMSSASSAATLRSAIHAGGTHLESVLLPQRNGSERTDLSSSTASRRPSPFEIGTAILNN